MADLTPKPNSNADTINTGNIGDGNHVKPLSTNTPRWVKVLGIVAFVLLLLFIILHLAGGGMGGH